MIIISILLDEFLTVAKSFLHFMHSRLEFDIQQSLEPAKHLLLHCSVISWRDLQHKHKQKHLFQYYTVMEKIQCKNKSKRRNKEWAISYYRPPRRGDDNCRIIVMFLSWMCIHKRQI